MATVTVLVEFKDSKRTVTGKASEIIMKLEEEIKKLDKHVKLVVDVDQYTAEDNAFPCLIQRYSTEWKDFVDVIDAIEIDSGDRLRVIPMPRSKKTPEVIQLVSMLQI